MVREETSNLLRQIAELLRVAVPPQKWLTEHRYRTRQNPRSVVQKACYLLLPCEGLKKDVNLLGQPQAGRRAAIVSEFHFPDLPKLLIQDAPVSSRAERMALPWAWVLPWAWGLATG
jgi:hypothetical protein